MSLTVKVSLQRRHNGRDGVSNHQPHDCFISRLFRHRSKKTSKLRVTGLRAGNSPEAGEFPAQMASNAENVSIWWRHHDYPWPSARDISCWKCIFTQNEVYRRRFRQGYQQKVTGYVLIAYIQWEWTLAQYQIPFHINCSYFYHAELVIVVVEES